MIYKKSNLERQLLLILQSCSGKISPARAFARSHAGLQAVNAPARQTSLV